MASEQPSNENGQDRGITDAGMLPIVLLGVVVIVTTIVLAASFGMVPT